MSQLYVPSIYYVFLFILIYLLSLGIMYLFTKRKHLPKPLLPVTGFISIFTITVMAIFIPEVIVIHTKKDWITICSIITALVIFANLITMLITLKIKRK